MNRLSLLFGLFLACSMALVIFILSLLAKVSLDTLVVRSLTVFFLFGILGSGMGVLLEIFLMRKSTMVAKEDLTKEMKLDDEKIEQNLGDLISSNIIASGAREAKESGAQGFKPAVFPQLTVEEGKVVKRATQP